MTTPDPTASAPASGRQVFSLGDPDSLRAGLRAARIALGKKQLVVIPTDTHYAIAADAFSPAGVAALARFKGWSEQPAPQVLLPNAEALHALGAEVPEAITRLTEQFWPGPLTVVVQAGSSVRWNLGDAVDRVGLSLIAHEVTRELLLDTGPLMISAAHPVGDVPKNIEALADSDYADLAVVLTDPQLSWDFSTPGSTVVEVVNIADTVRGAEAASGAEVARDAAEQDLAAREGDRTVMLRVLREGVISGDQLRDVAGDDVVWC
ncbi:tRNA A37 threonylcarbamoyladenosine synthetase subunit TsaC [Pontimonas salivibrio]|uniref:L-threonylcarbamoyladenylate synthase n=1 Tax=Pontimonas salivibrio TaxID=1159327 RepID=A0A2L2BRX1_9MICO|nr:Sua5/YciO/YrdC/YwlC family protein [Pontimonas salivibrio]AVG24377.1 tRNA A37 threonylcarbamoyladenosine synthetase subunit TsaC [Pontimonas salivibrio]